MGSLVSNNSELGNTKATKSSPSNAKKCIVPFSFLQYIKYTRALCLAQAGVTDTGI